MNPPPFLVSFDSLNHLFGALSKDTLSRYAENIEDLVRNRLPPVVSIRCLAIMFGYSARFMGSLHRNSENYYRVFRIPKGRKGYREIQAPRVALKVIQKWFGHHLSEAVQMDDAVYGFVKKRSAVHAARVHCGANWVYSVDIDNFFPSISLHQIIASLISIGYPPRGAEVAAKLCCFQGGLAQGSPASPVLSNLAFRRVDSMLSRIAKEHHLRFTRYADDIVFSGVEDFPESIRDKIEVAVQSECWSLSPTKEYFAQSPDRLKVHGLLVHGQRARLTKGYRNRIRAYRHLMGKHGESLENFQKIKGHLCYADSVNRNG